MPTCWQMQVFYFPVIFSLLIQSMNTDNILFTALDILVNHKRIHYIANNYDTLKVQVKAKQQKNL
jgi:uncharacterized membrane-anchored protein YitT (DUF2179 family)